MKLKPLLLLAVLAFAALLPRPAEARVEVSFDFFFDALSPHGEWIEVGDYGSCWRPAHVEADWRPYSDGYWSYTDGGWTWVSYEEFGGIVYHYGRWVDVEGEGWCWAPDYEWAPAWVSWRTSDDYIGWAPLPPEARWRRNTGFSVWVDNYYDIGPSRFNFCRVRDFGAPFLRPVIVSRFDNVAIIQHTANVTNISYFDGGDFGGMVHCGGPSFAFVNQHVHRPIPALKLVQKTQINNITNINVQNVNIFNAEPRGNSLAVLAPQVNPPTAEIRRPPPVRSIPAARIRKGWDGVKDPEVAGVIRTRMQQESRGLTPETAPARKVQAAELKGVPTQVDPSAPSPLRTSRERGNDTRRGEGAPTAIVQQPPQPAPAKSAQPVDARTAERMAREAARQPGQVPAPATPGAVAPPVPAEKPVAEQKKSKEPSSKSASAQPAERDLRSRQMTRSVPSAVAPGTAPATPSTPERSRSISRGADEAAAARARAQSAAAAQERAATEQRLRSAAMERQRAAEESVRRQKEASAQVEAARERQRREMTAPTARRIEPSEPPRPRSDDSGRKAAEAAVQRQRQMEAARSQQMEAARSQQIENSRREAALENARRSQVETARREQASQAARQQQMESARRDAAQENARRSQVESARREQAAASSRQAEASRQMEAARQAQQRSESMRREAPPQRYAPTAPPRSESRGNDRSEEADAIRKGRSR